MPSRWACVVILLSWAVATVGLVTRDVLPELLIGPPPDLRSLAAAEGSSGQTRWSILVADDPKVLASLRPVGTVVTESKRDAEGNLRLESRVSCSSGDLLQGTQFSRWGEGRFDVLNTCDIDIAGNLKSLHVEVRIEGLPSPIVVLDGVYKNHAIELKSESEIPELNFTKLFPYEPRSMIQSALGPVDRLPGLAVGQRWEERIVSPITGRIDVVKAEVTRKSELFWDKGTVATLEVLYRFPPAFTARTWVRKSDGLVLRQELPVPVVKLIIERLP